MKTALDTYPCSFPPLASVHSTCTNPKLFGALKPLWADVLILVCEHLIRQFPIILVSEDLVPNYYFCVLTNASRGFLLHFLPLNLGHRWYPMWTRLPNLLWIIRLLLIVKFFLPAAVRPSGFRLIALDRDLSVQDGIAGVTNPRSSLEINTGIVRLNNLFHFTLGWLAVLLGNHLQIAKPPRLTTCPRLVQMRCWSLH